MQRNNYRFHFTVNRLIPIREEGAGKNQLARRSMRILQYTESGGPS